MKSAEVAEEARVTVESDRDIVAARMRGRVMATELGFSSAVATLVATAISELARNILLYARRGEIVLASVERGDRRGLKVVARDDGPGIADVAQAMQDGFSTAGRLGLGLPGVRRLMDEFEVRSSPDVGTTVTVKKWNS
ncbi:MAG: anti-sigma regulatory factor [Candidatus Eisenbacteria bacterium]|uniref:Anti-sigma regulatory factor n=1 Tax=Eiseniibacteriota bacterium TaxID=2212470 RepID=A0A538TJA5_UNCEI|nr:MAG: anti-sigma regulatory factor [Candidatus Eisenbacteria bacterium]